MIVFLKRLKASTPPFFKKLRNICIGMSTTSTTALQFADSLPPLVQTALPYMVTVGLVGTLLSQLTVNNPDEIKDK